MARMLLRWNHRTTTGNNSHRQLSNLSTLVTYYSAIAICFNNPTLSSSFAVKGSNVHQLIASPSSSSSSFAFSTLATSATNSNSLFQNQDRFALLELRGGAAGLKMASTEVDTTETSASADIVVPDAKLSELRALMKNLGVDCFIVPTDDPHLCEYVPNAYKRREFLSGFKGSAGTAVVTADEALLWTDSRYHNEASLQLDANHWTLMKQGLPKVPTITKYIADLAVDKYTDADKPFVVGIDPFVHPASFAKEMTEAFDSAKEDSDIDSGDDAIIGTINTLTGEENLVDQIWADARPPIPQSPFRVHPLEYAGETVGEKVEEIREQMKSKKATLSVFTALDDIAYLLNVRATGDIATCPVGISYATVSMNEITLLCDPAKVQSEEVKKHLVDEGITLKPYDGIIDEITSHLKSDPKAKIWIDKTRSNYALARLIPEKSLVSGQNAVTPMKACKNKAEMEGMIRAHTVDGAAMAHFIAWLQNEIVNEKRSVSEVEIDEVLTGYRAQQPGYIEDSFPTIAGVGSNGAIIHYRASADSDLMQYLDTNNPILIDSGGQYTYGTTDVTRTWHFGEATEDFKQKYTRVLKGNIGVDSMIFPENTPGFVLDVFARKSLWEAGLDYGHGTGHGVGAALNVHEGPHSISPRWANKEVLKKGMVVSNEPGFYEDGVSGIRIENLLELTYVNKEDNVAYDEGLDEGDEGYPQKALGQKTFICFRKLTLIPIQKSLIVKSLMTKEEFDWLDAYHAEVLEKVSPLLEEGSPGHEWLCEACAKINRG